jgi:hypothetical protein
MSPASANASRNSQIVGLPAPGPRVPHAGGRGSGPRCARQREPSRPRCQHGSCRRTIFLIVSSGSPLALTLLQSALNIEKVLLPHDPLTPPRVRSPRQIHGTWRGEFFQAPSCPFLRFSKQETFPGSVSIHEFNAGSLQGGLDPFYGLVGNQSSFFFKIDDCR